MRTELRQKIDTALEHTIIGDVVFTEGELEELRCEIQDKYDEKLRYAMNPLEMLKNNVKVLIVLFVNYARGWESNSEQNFWENLFEKVLDDPDFNQSKLYDCFDDAFQHQRVFVTPSGKRSFYSTFLFHALAPKSSFDELYSEYNYDIAKAQEAFYRFGIKEAVAFLMQALETGANPLYSGEAAKLLADRISESANGEIRKGA